MKIVGAPFRAESPRERQVDAERVVAAAMGPYKAPRSEFLTIVVVVLVWLTAMRLLESVLP